MKHENFEELECNCPLCIRNERIRRVIASKDVKQLTRMVNVLNELLVHAEHEVQYHKEVLAGNWPRCAPKLALALAKIQRFE